MTALDLMKGLLRLKDERLIDASRIKALVDLKGAENPTRDVMLLTGVKTLVHKLPLKLYKDPNSRQTLLNAVQSALDEAIDQEEEVLEAEEESADEEADGEEEDEEEEES